jgi:TRAP-type C4-dicarboxylate transport system permease small subunit
MRAGVLRRISAGLSWLEEGLVCLFLAAMLLLFCTQIFLRVFFTSGIVWADPLLRYLVLWTGMMGAVVATRRGKHIAIDVVSHLLPKRVMLWLYVVLDIFSVAVSAVLTYASALFVRNEATFGGVQSLLGLDSWQLNLIFPVAFGLITLRFLVNCWQSLRRALTGAHHELEPVLTKHHADS